MKRFVSICAAVVLCFSLTACKHVHSWVDATCTEPKTCAKCGEQEGEALGHTWIDATCTEPKTCEKCGKVEGEPTGHSVANWATQEEPTCASEGQETGICTKCGDTIQQPIAKLEHTPGEWVVTQNATSSSAGKRTQSCVVCGEILSTEEFTLSAEEIEAQYKESCTAYDYNTIARDPDKYKFTYGKYTGEIIQVVENGKDLTLRVNITKGRYVYTDTIYVLYTQNSGAPRLLEDDIITIYGMNMGTVSYESIFGATITLPCVYAQYIDINK